MSFTSSNLFGSKNDTSTVWLCLCGHSEEQHSTAQNKKMLKMLFVYLTSSLLGLFLFSTAVGMFHWIFSLLFLLRITKKCCKNFYLSSWSGKRIVVNLPVVLFFFKFSHNHIFNCMAQVPYHIHSFSANVFFAHIFFTL